MCKGVVRETRHPVIEVIKQPAGSVLLRPIILCATFRRAGVKEPLRFMAQTAQRSTLFLFALIRNVSSVSPLSIRFFFP